MPDSFSHRYGYQPTNVEIKVREDAPEQLRRAVVAIAQNCGMDASRMRHVACEILIERPDPIHLIDGYILNEVEELLLNCSWFKVYDVLQGWYELFERDRPRASQEFSARVNRYFCENGIGWEMKDGIIVYRGSEQFQAAANQAIAALENSNRATIAQEFREALRDISRRPQPDIMGAIRHAMAALEGTAREISGEPNKTLGQLARHLSLPSPLDIAVQKLWGYASDRAHHIREGQSVGPPEAELLVNVACSVCTFLCERERGG